MRFTDKVVLVTGGGSGIGAATARAFAKEGARVAVADVVEDRARETAEAIRAEGGQALVAPGDVSNEEDARRMVEATVSEFGRIDVLFNNAGILIEKPVHELSEAEWDRVLDVNLKGVFLVSKHAVPHMMRRHSGVIVNTGSVNSLVGDPVDPAYCASKGGVALLTKSMALGYAAHGIRVNAVCPGWVNTRMFSQEAAARGLTVEEYRRRAGAEQPIGRIGTPEDIAQAVLFLASDAASYMTGSLLVIDGGISAR